MAKRIDNQEIVIRVDYVNSSYRIERLRHLVGDNTVTDLHCGGRLDDRDITSGELAGTLQDFLDSLKGDAETAEGIGA